MSENKITEQTPKNTATTHFKNPRHYKNGFLHNCLLMPHSGQDVPMFEITEEPDHYLIARLDGYAVIPMAEYERLKAMGKA